MTTNEILAQTDHRPWQLPKQKWKFYQEWNRAVFLHWQTDLLELRKFIPKELEIDLYDGKPWISLVAFSMEKIRPKYLPPFSPISNFDEINIRSYVKHKGKAGVYFLSIEGGKCASCAIAKGISGLPYRFSKMHRENGLYRSSNAPFQDQLDLSYELSDGIAPKTELDSWLTERYALFQDASDGINAFEIHHVPWPTNAIELKNLNVDYKRFDALLKGNPAKVHYSEGVQVLAWGKHTYKWG
ncbi:DUF2071 domain-containing protein [Flavobacteriaceae bacterium 3-367]